MIEKNCKPVVIVVQNEKGGPGKTTTAINLAAGLARRWSERGFMPGEGRRGDILIVDADEQGHATLSCGIKKYPGLYDLMVRQAPYSHVLTPVAPSWYGASEANQTRLYLLGGNVETRSIAGSISEAWVFADKIAEMAGAFDVVIIDTAPTPSLLHGAILLAADYLIVPTELEFLSFDGLAGSLKRLQATRRLHSLEIQIAGIIPNKYRTNTLEHQENLAALRSEFGDLVWPEIGLSTIWPEASKAGRPVFEYAPDSPAALAVWENVDRVEALIGVGVAHV